MAMTLKVLRGQRNSRPKFQKKFNKVISFFRTVLEKKLKYISCFLLLDMYLMYLCICKNWKKFLNFFLADVLYMQYYIVQETNYST